MNRTLLLVASYGTTHKETWHKTIGAVERHLARTFPAYEVRRTFTGKSVCRILEQKGEPVEHLSAALERAADDGFRNIILQPTHILWGGEYDRLLRQASYFAGKFEKLSIGAPLLSEADDYQAVAAVISDAFPPQDETGIVLAGHGTVGPANHTYGAMQTAFHTMGRFDILVGTLGACPGLDEITQQLYTKSYKKAVLAPLLLTTGRHFKNDAAGNQTGSWKSRLQEQGFFVEITMRSLGEYEAIWRIYEEHVRRAGILTNLLAAH